MSDDIPNIAKSSEVGRSRLVERHESVDQSPGPSAVDEGKMWRYMSFSRFVWLLQKKQLWLARADLLGDPWEITLTGDQLDHVISRHPISPLPSGNAIPETAIQRSERIIRTWRRQTFINCWTAAEDESYALWRIYCPSPEGVVIQTTFR